VHYNQIKGNADVAICTRASIRVNMPQTGLCVLWELKKEGSLPGSEYQAICQLVVANLLSPTLKPVVVHTDLRHVWRLLWLDGTDVHVDACDSRATVLHLIHGLIKQWGRKEPEQGDEALALPPLLEGRRAPPIGEQQARSPNQASDVACLADLTDCLPTEEARQIHVQSALQQLAHVPALSQAFFGMYS
jgi:hypothetical protein